MLVSKHFTRSLPLFHISNVAFSPVPRSLTFSLFFASTSHTLAHFTCTLTVCAISLTIISRHELIDICVVNDSKKNRIYFSQSIN